MQITNRLESANYLTIFTDISMLRTATKSLKVLQLQKLILKQKKSQFSIVLETLPVDFLYSRCKVEVPL